MNSEIEKIIADQMKKLPKDVVDAIVSVDYKTKLQEVTKRQKLLIDQAGKLEMETTLVMIGLEPLNDYTENIKRELAISDERAKEVSLDVSENIFKPIRESLYKMNKETESEEVASNKIEWGSTDTNDINLNRDQILSEIEDPSLIKSEITSFKKPTEDPENKIAINSSREIETLDEIPYQQDIKVESEIKKEEKYFVAAENTSNTILENFAPKSGLLETKMAGMTITSQQVVNALPEVKLPAVEKKRPTSGVDPYREEIK